MHIISAVLSDDTWSAVVAVETESTEVSTSIQTALQDPLFPAYAALHGEVNPSTFADACIHIISVILHTVQPPHTYVHPVHCVDLMNHL